MLACTAVSIKGSKNSISRGCQFTPHTDLTEKKKYLVGGWEEVTLDSIEVEASTHLVFSSIWTRAQQRLSFYLICASAHHWLLLLLLPRIPVSSCLPCFASLLAC